MVNLVYKNSSLLATGGISLNKKPLTANPKSGARGLISFIFYANQVHKQNRRLTSACTRLATAAFFKVGLLAKTHFIGAHLAHPQAGNARRWADVIFTRGILCYYQIRFI
jgi:hypothetical protein